MSDAYAPGLDVSDYESAQLPGVLLLDSIAYIAQPGFRIDARVIVSGSHGGNSAVNFVVEHREKPSLVFFNDAGVGLDEAGTCGLARLQDIGVPACAYAHWSARIGDAKSGLESGVISHCNVQARAFGLKADMRVLGAIQSATQPKSTARLREPDATGAPLRRFTDPRYQPLAQNLAEVRQNIDALDQDIVALLAKRAMWVKDAARFKADSFQVAAPARQAQVFSKVRQLAIQHNLGFEGFEDVVEQTYRSMVKHFVANETQYHRTMEPLEKANKL